jgi:NAD(P)-dependent dehydrogenase (short-subunit alcohol dehydrogenase family)
MNETEKIALVTGGNAGIGLETVRGLAASGMKVILLSRDPKKGEAAVKDVQNSTGNHQIECMTCDLASMEDIRRFAVVFKKRFSHLDVLVNNAGAFFSEYAETVDGIERQFAVNHLAPFLLTHELMPLLEASSEARIVNVSSNGHYQGKLNLEDLGFKKDYSGLKAYAQSKVCNVLFTRSLASRLPKHITANALHPGVVRTQIGNKNSSGWAKIMWILMKPFMVTPQKGAETSLYLATSAEVAGVTGKYFVNCKTKWPSRYSQDDALAEKLWTISTRMTGLG